MTVSGKIRVLIADGSVVERERMATALRRDPVIEVVGEIARSGALVDAVKKLRPDVIALGIHLPAAGGFEATKEIMIEAPTPVVVVSDGDDADQVQASILALRAGALAAVARPLPLHNGEVISLEQNFVSTIKGMAGVKVVRRWREPERPIARNPLPRLAEQPRIVAMAASTGGPAALQAVLSELPATFPAPILVVQHIAGGFVDGLVNWLNSVCSLKVKLASDGEPLLPHVVYIAPDDRHLGVSGRSRILLSRSAPIGGFRPSATFLFESVAKSFGAASAHVILTGMGQDGLPGLRQAHAAGARVVAQDEATSIVFGMPGAAVEAGVADRVVPLSAVAAELQAVMNGGE
jgi:two-component system, chemotaxis family, protein-glutamate methylesterase/glutaminase